MKTCPKCGKTTSIWSRDLVSGVCRACQQAEARAREEAAKVRAEEEQKVVEREKEREESVQIGGKKIACPICGHDRFLKQETLMNTRFATFLNLDWMNTGAETCICQQCGYVLWFRK